MNLRRTARAARHYGPPCLIIAMLVALIIIGAVGYVATHIVQVPQ